MPYGEAGRVGWSSGGGVVPVSARAGPAARRVDHASHPVAPTTVEEVETARDVDGGVEGGIDYGAPHRGLGGEVGHRLRPLRGEDLVESRAPKVNDVQARLGIE